MNQQLYKVFLFSLVFLSSFFFSGNIHAQNNIANIKITLNENQKSVNYVLNSISKQSGLKFSYNPKVIDDKKIISIKVYNANIPDVLNQIFGGKVLCKQVGNYLVLTENISPKKEIAHTSHTEEIIQKTQEKISEESVKKIIQDTSERIVEENPEKIVEKTIQNISEENPENSTSQSEIPAPIKKSENENIGKMEDTCLHSITNNNSEDMNKHFMALALATMIATDTIVAQEIKQNDSVVSTEIVQDEKPERKNRFINFSFVHPIGIHGTRSAKSNFNFSLSVLGDITGGTKGAEIASLFNINKFGVKGVQMASLFNLASTAYSNSDSTMRSSNLQFAAILNHTKAGTSTQFSGIYNSADNAIIQMAGIGNNAKKSYIQLAGIINFTNSNMFQAAGIANVSKSKSVVQLAGISNYTKTNMVQVAGIASLADTTMVQISGIANIAKDSKVQIGLVNMSKKTKVQIGLINIRDTADGVSIGLINIAKKGGVLEAGVEFGEFITAAATFRSGIKPFYTILSFGYNANFGGVDEAGLNKWGNNRLVYGYGLGSTIALKEKSNLNIELMVSHLTYSNYKVPRNVYYSQHNVLFQLRPLYTYEFHKHFKLFAGPTFNLFYQYYTFRHADLSEYRMFTVPYSIAGTPNDSFRKLDFWIGATFGFKF